MPEAAPERAEDPIEAEEPPAAETAPSSEPQAEPEAESAEEEALEYIEDPAIGEDLEDELEVSPEAGAMGEDESLAAGDAAEGLELAEVPEDIWGDGNAEKAPRFDEPPPAAESGGRAPPAAADPAATEPSAGEPSGAEEPLLGEPTARLLEYLKGLADELPPEKREEFDVSGFKRKVDDLIGKIKREAELSREPPPVLPRESGFGLLSAGQAMRVSDPRRGAEGRRALAERRAEKDRREREERRKRGERRESVDRRGGERRGPVPELELSGLISREAAPVTVAPDGTPTEVAGVAISPRMAKLIQIMRREKDNAR